MKYVKATAGCIYQKLRFNRHDIQRDIYADDVASFLLMVMVLGTMWLSLIQLN